MKNLIFFSVLIGYQNTQENISSKKIGTQTQNWKNLLMENIIPIGVGITVMIGTIIGLYFLFRTPSTEQNSQNNSSIAVPIQKINMEKLKIPNPHMEEPEILNSMDAIYQKIMDKEQSPENLFTDQDKEKECLIENIEKFYNTYKNIPNLVKQVDFKNNRSYSYVILPQIEHNKITFYKIITMYKDKDENKKKLELSIQVKKNIYGFKLIMKINDNGLKSSFGIAHLYDLENTEVFCIIKGYENLQNNLQKVYDYIRGEDISQPLIKNNLYERINNNLIPLSDGYTLNNKSIFKDDDWINDIHSTLSDSTHMINKSSN
jgi:hypothetical protein